MRLDLIGNSAVTIRDYDTIVHKHKLVLELMQGGFLTNCPPQWLALYGYLRDPIHRHKMQKHSFAHTFCAKIKQG
jgi:hypothetical protein